MPFEVKLHIVAHLEDLTYGFELKGGMGMVALLHTIMS